MPCCSDTERTIPQAEEIDRLTRLLCEACNRMDMARASVELKAWWAEHQEADTRRILHARKCLREVEDGIAAIKEMSPERRRVLGMTRKLEDLESQAAYFRRDAEDKLPRER